MPFMQQPFSDSAVFSHLRKHLKNHETVARHIRIVAIKHMSTPHSILIKVENTKQVLHQTFELILFVI